MNKYATESLTFKGLAVMIIGYLLTWLGYAVDSADIARLVDAVSLLVMAVGTIAAAIGRVRASRPIAGLIPPRK